MSKINISYKLGRTRFVRLPDGSAMAPDRFTATFSADGEGVAYEMDVELDSDGHSCCTRMVANGQHGLPSTINVSRMLRWATGAAAGTGVYGGEIDGGGFRMDAATWDEADAAFERQAGLNPTRRRDARSEKLKEAANAYNEGGVEAIKETLCVEKTTAYRLLHEARKKGLLTP